MLLFFCVILYKWPVLIFLSTMSGSLLSMLVCVCEAGVAVVVVVAAEDVSLIAMAEAPRTVEGDNCTN